VLSRKKSGRILLDVYGTVSYVKACEWVEMNLVLAVLSQNLRAAICVFDFGPFCSSSARWPVPCSGPSALPMHVAVSMSV
jgi:hypothetical protein